MFTWEYPWLHWRFFDANDDKGGGGSGDGGDGGGDGNGDDTGGTGDAGGDDGGKPSPTYATWYEALDALPKGLIDTHIAGLKSALKSQSDQRKALAKQLRDASAKLEKGSDAQKALDGISAKLEVAETRAQFYEDASRPEIGCSDVGLAYLAAISDELFDGRGTVDWDELKKTHPVLFGKPKMPRGDAGTGGGQQGTKKVSMNDWIRAAAGRRT